MTTFNLRLQPCKTLLYSFAEHVVRKFAAECVCVLAVHLYIRNLVEAHCYGIGRGGAIVEQSRSS